MSHRHEVLGPNTPPLAFPDLVKESPWSPAKTPASPQNVNPDATQVALPISPRVKPGLESPTESEPSFDTLLLKDLENAKEVHKAFFPRQNLSIPGLVCHTFCQPARYIGGDYYDFLPLLGGRWGIAIGDVSGKGIGAALLMASLQASLRAQAMHAHADLSTLISDVHRMVLAASSGHHFASLFYSEYDAATRELQYVNAGQNPPLVLRRKNEQCDVFYLETNAVPLGLLEGTEFFSNSFQLENGDVLVLYTDGITESESPSGELWGQERLEILLQACCDSTPCQIVRLVLEDVLAFVQDCSQKDDMTLVVVRVEGQNLVALSAANAVGCSPPPFVAARSGPYQHYPSVPKGC